MRCQTRACEDQAFWTWHIYLREDRDHPLIFGLCHEHIERVTPVNRLDMCGVDGCPSYAVASVAMKTQATLGRPARLHIPMCHPHAKSVEAERLGGVRVEWLVVATTS